MHAASEHIYKLLTLLAESNAHNPDAAVGASLYMDPLGTPHCVNLTRAQSEALEADWHPETRCRSCGPLGRDECQAQ